MTYRNMVVKVDAGSPILGTRVGVDFSTKNEVKRQLAANIDADDQLRFNGDVDCKITVDFLLRSDGGVYQDQELNYLFDNYHGTGASAMVLDIGGNEYSECFIDNFSLTVKPFEPVVGSVSFSCYSPSITSLGGVNDDTVNDYLNTQSIIYGHNCTLTNAGNVVAANIIDNLTYNKTYSRTPVYTLGSQQATSHLVDGVEVEMNVQSTGLNELIDFSGSKLTSIFGVALQDSSSVGVSYDSTDFDLIVNAGAHVVSEGYSMDGGGTLVTKATIKEVIL